jgi:predicted transcriptional regulator
MIYKIMANKIDRPVLGGLIKQRRLDMGLSQQALADMLDTTQPRIAEAEKGLLKDIDTYFACIEALRGSVQVKWKKPG